RHRQQLPRDVQRGLGVRDVHAAREAVGPTLAHGPRLRVGCAPGRRGRPTARSRRRASRGSVGLRAPANRLRSVRNVGPTRADLRATYRVQLRPDFGFDDAAAIADYLSALGVSHLYTSPQLA